MEDKKLLGAFFPIVEVLDGKI
jgi:hypothetical protein